METSLHVEAEPVGGDLHEGDGAPSEPVPAGPQPAPPPVAEADLFTPYCYAPHIIFRLRDKFYGYGAYYLRRDYKKRLLVSLLVGSVVFVLGISSPVIYNRLAPKADDALEFSRVVSLTQLDPPPLDPKAPPPPPVEIPPPPKVATVRFVPPEVAHDEEVAEEEIPPPQEEMKEAQAAAVTQEGDPNIDPNAIIVEEVAPEVAEVVGTPQREEEAEVFVVVEVMPEVLGGSQEVYKYVVYPEIAQKAGMEGLVVVQVVVEPNGSPSNPQVIRSAGEVLDQAAVDAVMQVKFIPGKQRGTPVRVKYAMPIRFRLRDASNR